MIKQFCFLLLVVLFLPCAQGQLVVNGPQSPAQLVENVLLGGGVTASNITFTGVNNARRSFTAVGTALGLDAGVILSTGVAANAAGAATNFAGDANASNDDADLELLSGQVIDDVAILEFDFIPTGDTLRFRYVFASEEYPEFVCSDFNDAFGFFLSGPGIAGPFANGAVNIALVPDTDIPITINTVNSGTPGMFYDAATCADSDPNWQTNSVYYVDNSSGPHIVYDGFTVILTAFALVECGATYHIKLAIGDGSDDGFDSAVFLEAGSFTSTGQVQPNLTEGPGVDGNMMLEGCGPYELVFTRVGELDEDATVTLNTTGTATPGVDYFPVIPTELYFPPNVETVTLYLNVPSDVDGPETIIVEVEQLVECANVVVQTAFTFHIDSPPPLQIQLADINSVCNQVNLLAPVVTGGMGDYTYLWSTSETSASISVTPGVTTTYTLTVSDACAVEPLTEEVTVTLPVYLPLDIEVSPATAIDCLELGTIAVTSATGGNNVYAYQWTLAGTSIGTTAAIDVPGGPPMWYIVTVNEGCGTSAQDSVLVSAVPLDPIVVTTTLDPTVICIGDTTVLEMLEVTGGNGVYVLSWADQNGTVLSSASSIAVGVSADHTYTITATDQCANVGSASVTTFIPHYAQFVLTMPADRTICAGDSITLQPTVTGASGYYYISWQDMTLTDPVLVDAPSVETTYTMTVTDQCGEVLSDAVTIDVEHVDVGIEVTNRGQDDWYLQAATLPYARTWVWDMGDGTRYRRDEVTHSYMDLNEHWVTLKITTPTGCPGVDSVLLRPPGHLYFPNAFTPDGDGINDQWGAMGHYMDDFEMTIFDRWGERIFTSTDMKMLWDGKVNGSQMASTGVYVYKYRAVGHLFPAQEGIGHVTLLAGSQD